MGCIVEFGKTVRFDFCKKNDKQKIWIDAVLRYGMLDLNGLASVIDIPVIILREVYKGSCFLDRNKAEELAKLLLILFSD
ncbi:MAG: hypothetical protein A3F46_03135 [Legionellales bacterium RIFCSPHIGHO2_12_FULL_42_9]|nr:MAG: hypothetical protein A3F46_03135 [Legionellales bacterium RIFCSPHIGHO2_12_FULL_42_9]